VVFAQVVEYLNGVRVRAAGHALEQQLLAARGNRLAEADREVLRVGELLVDGEREEVGGDPGGSSAVISSSAGRSTALLSSGSTPDSCASATFA
jgi:hypothetical protein